MTGRKWLCLLVTLVVLLSQVTFPTTVLGTGQLPLLNLETQENDQPTIADDTVDDTNEEAKDDTNEVTEDNANEDTSDDITGNTTTTDPESPGDQQDSDQDNDHGIAFNSPPTESILPEDLDPENLPKWAEQIPEEFIPAGWVQVSVLDEETQMVLYWTIRPVFMEMLSIMPRMNSLIDLNGTGSIEITVGGIYDVTGSGKRIVVNTAELVTLNLNDNITISDNNASPLVLNQGAQVVLVLMANTTSRLESTSSTFASVFVPEEANLTIDGMGTLEAVSSNTSASGAGIGGNSGLPSGNITIKGGNVIALSYNGAGIGGGGSGVISGAGGTINIEGTANVTAASIYGAGIGGGGRGSADGGAGGKITISGGSVNATSDSGAGIGGGRGAINGGDGGTITISGGEVDAQGGERGAGIGGGAAGGAGGSGGAGGNITITGTAVVTAKGTYGASIGGGYGNGSDGGAGGTIIISGGKVTAINDGSDGSGAGIGGGRGGVNGGDGGFITIIGTPVVNATGNHGAGIGGGYSNSDTVGVGGAGGTVAISGGTITASSSNSAGIGGGYAKSNTGGAGGIITISGGTVIASSSNGAGIGGGRCNATGGAGGIITISGGTVAVAADKGAGIGGGYGTTASGDGETVAITGGSVTARSNDGAGIGSGTNGRGVTTLDISDADVLAFSQKGYAIQHANSNGENSGTSKLVNVQLNAAVNQKLTIEAYIKGSNTVDRTFELMANDRAFAFTGTGGDYNITTSQQIAVKNGPNTIDGTNDGDPDIPCRTRVMVDDKVYPIKWGNIELTVTYDSNGGMGSVADGVKYGKNDSVTVKQITGIAPPVGKEFSNWNTKENGSGTSYAPNGILTIGASNVTLYAQWKDITYTVKFETNHGTVIADVTGVVYNNKIAEPGTPGASPSTTRTDCTLSGWYRDQALTQLWDFNTPLTETSVTGASRTITLYGKWETIVTLKYNNGIPDSEVTVDCDKPMVMPTVPTRTGYQFIGWFKEAALTNIWDFGDNVNPKMMLYAKWQGKPVNVIFNFNDDGRTADDLRSNTFGSKITNKPIDPTRTGYTFKGWFTGFGDGASAWNFDTVITSENPMTLYAYWEKVKYTVTFDAKGGSPTPFAQSVGYGEKVTRPFQSPSLTHYQFLGWFYGSYSGARAWDFDTETVTGNITLTARWNKANYTVMFDANSGTNPPATQIVPYLGFATMPASAPTKMGYSFFGWYEDALCTTSWVFGTPITEDRTLYAMWNAEKYLMAYDAQGGSPKPLDKKYEYATKIPRPPEDPVKEGFTFAGWYWYSASNQYVQWDYNSDTVPVDGTKLYAEWTTKKHTVYFDTQGGTTSGYSLADVPFGATFDEPDTRGLAKTGYTFAGSWFTDPACTQEWLFYEDVMPDRDITLYAKWIPNPYVVKFDALGGTPVPDVVYTFYGELVPKPSNPILTSAPGEPLKKLYGWYTNASCDDGDEWHFASDKVEDNMTLYARYETAYGYIVKYYIDSMGDSHFLAEKTGSHTFIEDHVLTAEDVALDLGENWQTLKQPERFNVGSCTFPTITALEEENIVTVVYVQISVITPPIPPDVSPPNSSSRGGTKTSTSGNIPSMPKVAIIPAPSNDAVTRKHSPYMYGYPDGSFRPQNTMTRAEAAQLFYNLLPDKQQVGQDVVFADVLSDAWYAPAVRCLAGQNIIEGRLGRLFWPDVPINRGEFAIMLAKFKGLSVSPGQTFTDTAGHFAAGYIESVAKASFMAGYPDGTFKSDQNITRVEVVVMINRMLGRGIDPKDVPNETPQFSDVDPEYWAFNHIVEATVPHSYTWKEYGSEVWVFETNGTK